MSTLSATTSLACQLIERASVTPDDAGCQALLIGRLNAIGFQVTQLPFGDVENFWAIRGNDKSNSAQKIASKVLCFAGHTDVVPTGDVNQWQTPPFAATIIDGQLYGRGAADMKGSLAAMVVACEKFVAKYPDHSGQIAFLITSDEEGIATNGTVKVVDWLSQKNKMPEWCIVGEPSSTKRCGDVVKNGRRGSLGAVMTVKGVQGHVAYPHLADNPIHKTSPALSELCNEIWDEGNDFFPATSFQISNINGGSGATNVIPGSLEVVFNFRFSTELSAEQLQQRCETILTKHGLDYDIHWHLSGQPFLTSTGKLVDAVRNSIHNVTGLNTELSTAGGTSDGRFIAPKGTQVIELGPVNASIHKVDENTSVAELDDLTEMYYHIMENLLV